MSLPFELCQMIPNAVAIASRKALAGVLTTRCMPRPGRPTSVNGNGNWKGGQDGVVLGSIL